MHCGAASGRAGVATKAWICTAVASLTVNESPTSMPVTSDNHVRIRPRPDGPIPSPWATEATADLAPDSGYESQGYKFATTISTPTIRPAIPR
jgi:hypothetical protein